MKARRRLVAGWLTLALSAGCTGAHAHTPPAIRYGESACAECRMLINEARFAVTAVTHSGEPVAFDSTECLVRYLQRGGHALAETWVHDYAGSRWLPADQAFYVVSSEFATPMGQGIVAVGSEFEARALAAQVHGQQVTFAQLPMLIQRVAATNETRSE